jgi:hypothetical protein
MRTSKKSPSPRPLFLFLFLFVLVFPSLCRASVMPTELRGAWKEKGGNRLLHIAENYIEVYEHGALSRLGLVELKLPELLLRREGLLENWWLTRESSSLKVRQNGMMDEYLHLQSVPEEFTILPIVVGTMTKLPPERIKEIQEQLVRRLSEDQAVRKEAERKVDQRAVDAENLRYFTALIRDIGWIDVARFGDKASCTAAIFVNHSGNLALRIATLPSMEKDLKNSSGGSECFMIVYDSLALQLGGKQRYGSQICADKDGKKFVCPLEDRARVDMLRKEIGAPSLAEYLAAYSSVLYGGKEIPLPNDEQNR